MSGRVGADPYAAALFVGVPGGRLAHGIYNLLYSNHLSKLATVTHGLLYGLGLVGWAILVWLVGRALDAGARLLISTIRQQKSHN